MKWTLSQVGSRTNAPSDPDPPPAVPILTGIRSLEAWMKKLLLSADEVPPKQHKVQLSPANFLVMTPLHKVFPQILRPPRVCRLLRVLLLSTVMSRFALVMQSPHPALLQPFPSGSLGKPR